MSLLQALNISAGAMGVHQNVISITSNNIANMNTEGYHKQRAHLGTLVVGIPIGESVSAQVKTSAGVELIKVQRYQESFLGSYYRDQLSEQSYLQQKADGLGDIAGLFDDLDGGGINGALTEFYDALDNLNQYPTDMSARINLLNTAESLTNQMNLISNKLASLKTQDVGDGVSQEALNGSAMYSSIQGLNASLEELASINKMILQSQTGSLENNNLLDRRDSVLNELAKYAGFSTEIESNGTATVTLNGTKIISGATQHGSFDVQTAAQYDEYCQATGLENTNECNAVIMFKRTDGFTIQNMNNKMNGGALGGMVDGTISSDGLNVNSIMASMDTLAQTVANVFNNILTREGSFYLDNATGQLQLSNDNLEAYVLFKANDGTDVITASNISVNGLLLQEGGYNKIAAAYFENYDPTNPDSVDLNAVGNADNIISMISTKSDATGADFAAIGNLTFADFYNGILNQVTSGLKTAENAVNAQNDVVTALDNQAKAETSVDLNEELTELIKSQTAYSASARVFSTCNTLLDTLINLGL